MTVGQLIFFAWMFFDEFRDSAEFAKRMNITNYLNNNYGPGKTQGIYYI